MRQSSRLFGISIVLLGSFGLTSACAEAEDPEGPGSGGRNVGSGGRLVAGSASGGRSPSGGFGGAGGSSVSAGQGVGGGSTGLAGADAGAAGTAGSGLGQGGTPDVPLPEACVAPDAAAGAGGAGGAGAGGATSGALVVELKANSDAPGEFPSGEVQITNEGAANVALNGLELRYYVQSEYEEEQTDDLLVAIDHAQVRGVVYRTITQNVDGDVVVLGSGVAGADAYLSIAFEVAAGTLMPGETTLVQFRVTPPQGDSSYYDVPRDQSNDYSFGACSLHPAPFRRVVLLQGGNYVSGEPPRPADAGSGQGGAGGAGGMAGASSQAGGAGAGGAF